VSEEAARWSESGSEEVKAMKTSVPTDQRDTEEKKLRQWFIVLALALAVVGGLHFVDHVIRGSLVVTHHLDPNWDHSGWPFEPQVTVFTFSLFGVLEPMVY
jgi:hypothetical protein